MRHLQDDLLIEFAFTELAADHKKTPMEMYAIELAMEIADRHGLISLEATSNSKTVAGQTVGMRIAAKI